MTHPWKENIDKHLRLQPDQRPDVLQIKSEVERKSRVCYFPLNLPMGRGWPGEVLANPVVHIAWPHRWEHDKDPEAFCQVMMQLHENGLDFKVSMLGEVYDKVPEIITTMKETLGDKIAVFGFVPSKQEYYNLLSSADVVVSTAKHEFYGVSMLEAAWLGCYPLAPNNLVYPELYPQECLYNTINQLYKKLAKFCLNPNEADTSCLDINFSKLTGEEPLQQLLLELLTKSD